MKTCIQCTAGGWSFSATVWLGAIFSISSAIMLLTPLSNSRVPCSFMRSLHVLARVGFPQVLQFPPAGQKHCELRGLGWHADVDTRCLVMAASLESG